jgi:ABC-type multidrug transport system fused ATPase/permease subunit
MNKELTAQTDSSTNWQISAGKHVEVYALPNSYAAKKAAGELRLAEAFIGTLIKLLSPRDTAQPRPFLIYLIDAVTQSNGRTLPTLTDTSSPISADVSQVEDTIVVEVQPEAPEGDWTYFLTRACLSRWFGKDAASARIIVEGLAGWAAASNGIGSTLQEADDWVLTELKAGKTISLFVESAPMPEKTIHEKLASTSFVAFLILQYEKEKLYTFFNSYNPAQRDQAVITAYQQPLGKLEESWLNALQHSGDSNAFLSFLKYLAPLLKRRWINIFEVLIYIPLLVAFALALPVSSAFLVGQLKEIDTDKHLIAGLTPSMFTHDTLVPLIIILIFVYILQSIMQSRFDFVVSYINEQVAFDLRMAMIDRLQKLPHAYYNQAKIGDVMARFLSDVSNVQGAYGKISDVIYQLALVLTAGIIMLQQSPYMGVVVLTVIFIFYLISQKFSRQFEDVNREGQKYTGEAYSSIQEILSSHATIKAFGLESRFKADYYTRSMAQLKAMMKLFSLHSRFGVCVDLTVASSQILILGLGGYFVTQGKIGIEVLVLFIGLLPRVISPIRSLTGIVQLIQTASGSMERINEIILPVSVKNDKEIATTLPELEKQIQFDNVSFSYDGNKQVLKNINLTILAGQNISIVGPTGSGKSTIANLLMRFWDPTKGQVLFDENELKDVTVESLRSQIGIVFQDTFIFDSTVRENILAGRLGATDDEVTAAAHDAQLGNYIEELPAGYDTVLGERGVRMSGGERQRLAIARVVLRNPRILILDEATSSLDSRTEREIWDTLSEVAKGRTTISITHRLASAAVSDHIFVLNQGELVEDGTHEELMRAGGLYQYLYNEQMHMEDKRRTGIEIDRLRAIPLFTGLGLDELLSISEQLKLEPPYTGGQDIVRQGDPGDRLFIITHGQAEAIYNDGFADRRVNVLNEGDYFGEMALLSTGLRNATVRAITPVQLYSLAQEDFKILLDQSPEMRQSVEKTITLRRKVLEELPTHSQAQPAIATG